jgi:NAD(P)H dehydrogenase (quinone)
MNVLVVHAHPSSESYSNAIYRTALKALESAGHSVTGISLYAEGFEARMSRDERVAYETEAPVLDPLVARHVELVKAAQMLVFVYPTWWFGLPAILKGWLERVLVPGVGFVLDPKTNKVKRGLGHVKRVVGITTYGSPRSSIRFATDGGRRTLTRALRLLCHPLARTRWLGLYAVDTSTDDERLAFLSRVETELSGARRLRSRLTLGKGARR